MNLSPQDQVADPVARPLFPSAVQRRAASACLITLMAAQLLYHFSGLEPVRYLSWAAMLSAPVVSINRLGLREYLLMAVAAAMAFILFRMGSLSALAGGLDLGALLSAFVLLLGLLRESAVSSPSVLVCGDYLTRQPPQRRYATLHSAGHVFGLLLNFGALALLAPLIQRGVRAGNYPPDGALIRERRQLSALIRGFSWIVTWSPTTVTNALLASIIVGVDHVLLTVYGLILTVLMLIAGWAEDYVSWRVTMARVRARGAPPVQVPPFPVTAFRNFGAVCLALVVLPAFVIWLSDVKIVHALMLSAPVVTLIWLLFQSRADGPAAAVRTTRQKVRDIADFAIPNTVREAMTMGYAGILGTALAAVAPVNAIAATLSGLDIHPVIFLVALPVLMALAAQFALSPVMTIVFLAAIVSALPVLPADPTLIALALACGWALSVVLSPNVSAALVLSRMTGHKPVELTWRWNGCYGLLMVLGFGLYFWLLTSL